MIQTVYLSVINLAIGVDPVHVASHSDCTYANRIYLRLRRSVEFPTDAAQSNIIVGATRLELLILTVLCQSVVNFTSPQMSRKQFLLDEYFCYNDWIAARYKEDGPLESKRCRRTQTWRKYGLDEKT